MYFDEKSLKESAEELGIGKHYLYIPLVFLNKTLNSRKKIGENFTRDERKELYRSGMLHFDKIGGLI